MFNKFGAIVWLFMALAGCGSDGSGGGIGGSGITILTETGATSGSITGFGSIVVNGARYDTDNATFFNNDEPISQGELRVGMNILASVDFANSVASQVDYVPSLIGPVESINPTDNSIQSLGQTIRLGRGTSFNNLSFGEIAAGMVVEVSGLRNATGVIFATFIRPAQDTTRFQLVGAILSNLSEDQFTLNGLDVNIAQADLSQISPGELEFGDKVYVTADSSAYDFTGNILAVDSVRVALEPMVTVGERVEYEGIVSGLTSPFEFDVYWQPITASDQTIVEYQDGTPADLRDIRRNSRLEVEGIVQTDGSYQALKIILIATENSKLVGQIERITPETSSFTLLGLDIQVDNSTRFDGSSDAGGNQDITSFDQLRAGDYVEAEAAFVGTRLIAKDVKVDDVDERAILEGPVTALDIDSQKLDVINQTIGVAAGTSYENRNDEEIGREAFFELLRIGGVVKARWDNFTSVGQPPDSLQIE